jgi:hypothetical protein
MTPTDIDNRKDGCPFKFAYVRIKFAPIAIAAIPAAEVVWKRRGSIAVVFATITRYNDRTVMRAKAVDEYVTNKDDVCATTANVFQMVRNESQNSIARIVTKIGTPIAHLDCPGWSIGSPDPASSGGGLKYFHHLVGTNFSDIVHTLDAIWKAFALLC